MENTYNLVSNATFPVMWFTRQGKHPFIYWKNKLLGACQVFKLWMKWPDGTSDDAKPQSHTGVCQLYTRAHTAGRAIAASDSGGYLWTSTHFIFIPTTDSSDLTMPVFHINRVQQAKRQSLSKLSKIVKICPTDPYLYCWWSLVLRVFAMKRSASFSRFLEYSISISDFFLKKSWRSCSSWTLMSVCWSKHFCCSTSWARISGGTPARKQVRMVPQPLGTWHKVKQPEQFLVSTKYVWLWFYFDITRNAGIIINATEWWRFDWSA